jgi:hypothetical protein
MKNKFWGILGIYCLFCTTALGQAIGTWTSHLAYQNATLIAETPHRVFAVFEGNLLSYSPEDQLVKTYSIETGLHGNNIRFLHYSPEANALLIIYQDANMDIFAGDQEIYNLNYITGKNSITNKTIYSVEIRGHFAYLSTAFGILEVDLQRKEVKENYLKNYLVTATCQWGNDIYAATTVGLFKVSANANLWDDTVWQRVSLPSEIKDNAITQLVVFDNKLVLYDQQTAWSYASAADYRSLFVGWCRQLAVFNNQLALATWNAVLLFSDLQTPAADDYITLDEYYSTISSNYSNGKYWVAWGDRGITQIAPGNDHSYATIVPFIQLDSPWNNSAFRLTFSDNQLLVTGGGRNLDRYNLPGLLEVYENGHWKKVNNNKDIQEATGFECKDFISAVIDPLDADHYYVSSWGEGIYEFQDQTFVNLYSYENSSLQTLSPSTSPNKAHYVRVDGMAFDQQHNLYATNASVTNGLSVLQNNGQWKGLYYKYLSGTVTDATEINQLIITRKNQKWVNLWRLNRRGIFVVADDNGTIDDTADDVTYYAGSFQDQQDFTINASNYLCMVEDLNGQVWVGTDDGLIYFTSAEQVGQGRCNRLIGTDDHNEGFPVLEGKKITSIAIDGANRKWIGTAGEGVLLLDHSGSPTVTYFDTSNSDILSDNINDIAVNKETGEVFIATDQGLCSYRSDATPGRPDYSDVHVYPNPVYPNRRALVTVTGLMSGSWVKVTDIAGNLMTEGNALGGQYTWNCVTPRGELAKAGIHLVFADLPTGEQGVVTKFMVIR